MMNKNFEMNEDMMEAVVGGSWLDDAVETVMPFSIWLYNTLTVDCEDDCVDDCDIW